MDFQVGDEVFCLLNGEGVVAVITPSSTYPVTVDFGMDCIIEYGADGRLYHENKNPCLYHKGTVVTIKPAQPKRYKWVNVYVNTDGDCEFSDKYYSEIAARELIFCNIPNYKYVDTIQLKPKGEK